MPACQEAVKRGGYCYVVMPVHPVAEVVVQLSLD